jgi:NAD(P)-dependent dehydrogenase (short-subunit alcohol dehydrogenase family)
LQQERNVVITGAAGGIGSLLVERFLSNQDRVFSMDRNAEGLSRLQSDHASSVRLVTFAGDVAKREDTLNCADLVRTKAGHLQVLVNCAGDFPFRAFDQMSYDEWREILDTNLGGVFLMVQAMLPLMKAAGWGRVINFGSASIFEGVPAQVHYVCCQSGCRRLIAFAGRGAGRLRHHCQCRNSGINPDRTNQPNRETRADRTAKGDASSAP